MRDPVGPFVPLSPEARARSLAATLARRPQGEPLWVFGYGSLLWRAGFEPLERVRARLDGFRRAFCVWTVEARGTPARPGLGLGLVPACGRSCEGIALGLGVAGRRGILERLWEREMLTGVYAPRWVRLDSGRGEILALAFVVDPSHPQHAGDIEPAVAARHIARAYGVLGPCREYLRTTVEALGAAGIDDPELTALQALVPPSAEDT